MLKFFTHFLAKSRHSCSLLDFRVWSPSWAKPISYPLNFSCIIILIADFCTLSRSLVFSSVRLLCQTVADYSRMLLPSAGVPKLATFLNNCNLAFSVFTILLVLRSQVRSSDRIVPSNLVFLSHPHFDFLLVTLL